MATEISPSSSSLVAILVAIRLSTAEVKQSASSVSIYISPVLSIT
jgi:hypothetical protein